MKIIITGGSGLIGRHLAPRLLNDGHEVIIFSRRPAARGQGWPADIQFQAWDPDQPEGWAHQVDGVDAVINLAGESIAGTGLVPARWTEARKQRIVDSRVRSGQALVQAITAAARKPAVLIQASAVGYYGQATGDAELSEDSPAGDDFLGRTCQLWEASTADVEAMGVRRPVIRTGVVFSKEGGSLPLMVLPFRLFIGGRLGDGRQWLPWIHIEDEVNAIRFLLQNEEATGPFNLTAPTPITNRELSALIGRILHRPSFFPVPELALRLLLGEIATLVVDGQRALPTRLLALGFTFKYPDPYYALRDLLRK